MSTPTIRLATTADVATIRDIYNYYVLHSTCTYQLEPETLAEREQWFARHSPEKYPVIVAELNQHLIGWGSLSPFHARAGYAPVAEPSVYIHHQHHRLGAGRAILQSLIDRARQAGLHTLVGGASAEQSASLALQTSLGFQIAGRLKEVGLKFGQRLDVVYTQLLL